MTGRRTVAAAVIRRAQMRAAFDDLAGYLGRRQTGVVAVFLAPTAWILWDATSLLCIWRVLGGPPVGSPLPDIADHVVDAVAIGRVSHHRRRALVSVLAFIFVREISLPGIGAMLSARRELIA